MIFGFCIFLDPSTLQNSLLKSRRFLPDSFGFSKLTIISSAKIDHFSSAFLVFSPVFKFVAIKF